MQPFKAFRLKSRELLKFIKSIFSKKTLRLIAGELANTNQSDGLKAFSAGFGIFMGIVPIWGLQTVAAIFIAVVFRLNKALVVIFSQVSFPPIFPLVLLVSYRIGRYWTGEVAGHTINARLEQYLYGSITLAMATGLLTGVITYLALKGLRLLKQYQLSLKLKRSLQAN